MPITKTKNTTPKAAKRPRHAKRVILDPPFPSTLGDERIRQAVIEFARENRAAKPKLAKRVVKDSPLPSVLGKDRIREAVWGRYPGEN